MPDAVLTETKIDFATPVSQRASDLSVQELVSLKSDIMALMEQHKATLVAHYYTDAHIQSLAEECGGFVGDSLEMARFGHEASAQTLLVAGVRFMGETAKILSPNKKVLMPSLEATCSLDLGCPIEAFEAFCEQHPDRTVVVYANTSAAVKARADWVVTSSIAVDVVDYLDRQGQKILWAPDQYLGDYVQKKTGADMLLWNGSCIVHEEFRAQGIVELKLLYPDAAVLVHPESPSVVIELADVVGSTTQLIEASANLDNPQLIVATDRGIFHKMQQKSPNKTFIEAPTAGQGASCRSCAHCPWMAMNSLQRLKQVLLQQDQEVKVAPSLIERARLPLDRMLKFAAGR